MSNISKVGAFFLAVLVFACSLVVPAFAQSSTPDYYVIDSSVSESVLLLSGSRESSSGGTWYDANYSASFSSITSDVYVVCYYDSSVRMCGCTLASSGPFTLSFQNPTELNSTYNLYINDTINNICGGFNSSFSVSTIFSSKSDAFDYLVSVTSSGGASSVDQPLTLSVPAGNIAYIEIPSGVANQITATSSSALDHKSPWTGSNQAWGYASSLPSSSLSVPVSGTSAFTWEKAGGTNIFGTTRSWKFFSLLNSSNKYVVIVNPAYPDDQPNNQAINGTISVSLPHASSYRVYSLSTEWSDGSLVGSWDAQSDSSFEGTFDSDTESWSSTDSTTGLPGSPQAGGSTIVGQSSQNIHDWLQTIANSISGFFNGAIGAVSTLVGAASDFVSSFIHLYNWLPGSVLSVLTSAMIIAITIGVIKVFI